MLPADDDDGVEAAPAVPVGLVAEVPLVDALLPDELPIVALVRMKFESVVLADAAVLPLVPVAPEVAPVARATQPVTVI